MACFLKFSRLTFKPIKFCRPYNLFLSQNKLYRWKNIPSLNAVTIKEFCSISPKVNMQLETAEDNTLNTDDTFDIKKSIRNLEEFSSKNYFVNVRILHQMLDFLKDKDQITSYEANLLIKICGHFSLILKTHEKVQLADKVISVLENLGFNLAIIHFNTLLSVYLQNNKSITPKQLFDILQKRKLEPNSVTFHRLFKICCYEGNVNGASEVLEIIKEKDIPITEDIFNSLIYGHGKNQDMESAVNILDIMQKKNIEPTSETYSNLICGYAMAGNFDEIENIFKICEEKDIVFFDEELLHIIYILALKNQNNYIHNILPKLKCNYGYNLVAQNYILRLLEHNLDNVAFEIFHTMTASQFSKKSHGKFMLEYFRKYRSVEDIINFCKLLEKKDYDYDPFSFALERTLVEKNDELAFSFLETLKQQNFSIFPNCFWPILINASKKNNETLLNALKKMKKIKVAADVITTRKIIYNNYNFGQDVKADLEKLYDSGVRVDLIARYLIFDFLKTTQFNDALKIARIAPVSFFNDLEKDILISSLSALNDTDLFVDMMHGLIHDFHSEDSTSAQAESEKDLDSDAEQLNESLMDSTRPRIEPRQFAEVLLKHWALANNFKEDDLIKILQKMLEKGIGISKEFGDFIRENCKSTKVDDFIIKLIDNNLKIQLNEEILNQKKKYAKVNSNKAQQINHAFENFINKIKILAINGEDENVTNLVDNLEKNCTDETISSIKLKFYYQFLQVLARSKNFEAVEKAYNFGVAKNIIEPKHFSPMISCLIKREEIEKAVDLYCKKAEECQDLGLWADTVKKVIELENSVLLQQLINVFTKVKDENFALSILIYTFAKLNRDKEIRKLMDSKGSHTSVKTSGMISNFLYRIKSIDGLTCFLKATSGYPAFFRKNIYIKLGMLYIENEDLLKLKDLLVKMEEENVIPSLEFVELLTDFYNKKGEVAPFSENFVQAKAL